MRRNPDYLRRLHSLLFALTTTPTSSRSQKPEAFMCFVSPPLQEEKSPVHLTLLALLTVLQCLQAGMLNVVWWPLVDLFGISPRQL